MDHEVDEMPNSMRSRLSAWSSATSGRRNARQGDNNGDTTALRSSDRPKAKQNDAAVGHHGDGERNAHIATSAEPGGVSADLSAEHLLGFHDRTENVVKRRRRDGRDQRPAVTIELIVPAARDGMGEIVSFEP